MEISSALYILRNRTVSWELEAVGLTFLHGADSGFLDVQEKSKNVAYPVWAKKP